MYFPISGVTVNPLLLIGVGFVVGVLGGFFGVGGGFLAGPLMFLSGVPMNFVVGTDLAHMAGKSIVAARRHRAMGHVDIKLGLLMVGGTVVGVELGARGIEALKRTGHLDSVLSLIYIGLLTVIGVFTLFESLRALRMQRTERLPAEEVMGFAGLTPYMHRIKLPPMISLPGSGIGSISLWVVLGVGFITGVLSGLLGVGGGFIRMPLLIYVLGVPTHVAVGTDLFEIMISSAFGTVTHALKGNVDVLMALVMQTGAAVGAQVGAVSTRYFDGPRIRLLFSILPFLGVVLMALRVMGVIGVLQP
ncbi:MAG: sulfite exporter TauE/SafE family protein [Chloroflexota bacterium]